jgi:nitrate reductase NapAB chaperone NapD
MNVSGIVVACRPESMDEVRGALDAFDWADVHYTKPDGRMVVTIEAADEDASIERLKQVKGLPKVLMAEMSAYFIEGEQA